MIKKILNTAFAVVVTLAVTGCATDPTIDPNAGINDAPGMMLGGPETIRLGDGPVNIGPGTSSTAEIPPAIGEFQPLPAEEQVWPNILFARNKYFIGTSESGKLDKLAEYLNQNTNLHVQIAGHCSVRGSEEYNRGLSEKRALSAQDYLIAQGVNPNNISTVAYGEEKPAVQGSTESAHSKNRRDEFLIGTR